MEPIGTITGLASGIDFRELVDAIIQAESQPALRLAQRKSELDVKTTAWGDVELRLKSVYDRSEEIADPSFFRTFTANVVGGEGPLGVSADSTAVAGSFAVEVLQLATRESVGGDAFADRSAALGLSGEFVVGGAAIQVTATDSLDDIALSINSASAGSASGGVSATVVGASGGGHRMVLTAASSGSDGIRLSDGTAGLLRTLGFMDTTTSIRHATSDGATSDGFSSASADISTLLGLSSPPPASSVGIGSLAVLIDLSTDSLDDIADSINAAATVAGSAISAQVISETGSNGSTVRRLDINSTTSFTDTNGVLETLGVLEGSRSSVAQAVQGASFTDGDAVTAATGTTLLTDLWISGSDAGVQVGDTLTLRGTHGDGTSFDKTVVVGAGNTYQDLVTELNSGVDGFGVGARTATATISGGAVVVTDDTAGGSQLALSIISHNEGGGVLDFGDFATLTEGRRREITSGLDAQVLVDGALYERSSNKISDVVQGVTMSLDDISTGGPVTVDIAQDVDAIVGGIEAYINAFNNVSEFVLSQFSGVGAEEGEAKRPLSGDGVVRQIRNRMRAALQTTFPSGLGSFSSIRGLGIEANRDGTFDIDSSALRSAVESDPLGVQRVFTSYGVGSASTLEFVSAGSKAEAGTYDVLITAAATRAGVTGVGFGGTYVDDGIEDTMTITDSSTASSYSIALTNGMTLAQIVDELNAELALATTHELNATEVMRSDAVATEATDATLLQDLFNTGGGNLGVADGDLFTISGTRADGSSFFREWTVSDVSTQTLGTLRTEIAGVVGGDVIIDIAGGVLTASAVEEGRKPFTLNVTSDNAGGGSFSFGSIAVVTEGRAAGSIEASDVGGQLALLHDDYGASEGFTVAYAAGGADGSASLGLAAESYAGADVAGTIGGHDATGQGLLLTGSEESPVEGLVLEYAGATVGAVGSMTYAKGIASLMESITDEYMNGGETSIQGIVDRLDTQKRGFDDRITAMEARLELRSEGLIRRFTALEEAMAKAQNEMAWLQAQLGSLLAP